MIALAASEVADRIRNARTFPNGGVLLTDTVRLRDLDAPPRPRTYTPGRRLAFEWRGPANVPAFSLENCRDWEATRVDLRCETPCEAAVVCERTRSGPGVIPSTMHGFRRWRIYGNGLAARGFWYRSTVDENNEHGEFHANAVYGCARAFVFEGQQSKHHRLTHNVVETYEVAVTADSAFDWQGGTIAVGGLAFELTRAGDPVMIASVGVEATGRLLVTAGPTTDAQSVRLVNVRFEADQLHWDSDAIVVRHAGTVSIRGGRLGGGAQRIPFIRLAGIGEQSLSVRGVDFGAFGASLVYPVRMNPGVRADVPLPYCTFARPAGASERTATRIEAA